MRIKTIRELCDIINSHSIAYGESRAINPELFAIIHLMGPIQILGFRQGRSLIELQNYKRFAHFFFQLNRRIHKKKCMNSRQTYTYLSFASKISLTTYVEPFCYKVKPF